MNKEEMIAIWRLDFPSMKEKMSQRKKEMIAFAIVGVTLLFVGSILSFAFWSPGRPQYQKADKEVNAWFSCKTEGVICETRLENVSIWEPLICNIDGTNCRSMK